MSLMKPIIAIIVARIIADIIRKIHEEENNLGGVGVKLPPDTPPPPKPVGMITSEERKKIAWQVLAEAIQYAIDINEITEKHVESIESAVSLELLNKGIYKE